MDKLKFAPAKPAVRVNTIPEAYEQVLRLELSVTPTRTELGKLLVLPDGTIKLGELYRPATSYGFINFCKILGIPEPFANKIPIDLLLTNIKRLQEEHSGVSVSVLERSDGTIANVLKGEYKEVDYTSFLSNFDGMTVKYVDVGERLMVLAATFEELPVLFKEDDPLYVGTYVYNSILRTTPLHMFSGLFRTQCSNSFLAPYMGKFRADYKLEPEERMLRFVESIRCYDEKMVRKMQESFNILETRRMFEGEVVRVWKKLNSIVGPLDSDLILGLNSDMRKAMVQEESAREIKNKLAKLRGEAVREKSLSSLMYYDVLNAITANARDRHQEEKKVLENIAGVFLKEAVLA